jgi:hypothetical protein
MPGAWAAAPNAAKSNDTAMGYRGGIFNADFFFSGYGYSKKMLGNKIVPLELKQRAPVKGFLWLSPNVFTNGAFALQ